MYAKRQKLLEKLENSRDSKALLYVTGDRPGWETQISSDAFDCFVDHLDEIGVVKRISLLLYTRGGDTLAGWSLINLIKQFCEELEVIIPHKCHSCGTLIALGANKIVMTKQATLGPIDPSVNTPLNPGVAGAPPDARVPVSVEGIQGFINLARDELEIGNEGRLTDVLIELSRQVHPLVLGQVIRAKSQIQMLARRLLAGQVTDDKQVNELINFLTSESGSHDYTINRREARQLGLQIESPDDGLYDLIKDIYDDFKAELELTFPFDLEAHLGANQTEDYELKRVLVESVGGGSFSFQSEGTLARVQLPTPDGPQQGVNDTRKFEGWRKTA